MKTQAQQIFTAGVAAVRPDKLLKSVLKIENGNVRVADAVFDLQKIERIYVIAAGKASALMALAAEKLLGTHLTGGIALTKYGHALSLEKIEMLEAGHPLPDENGVEGTRKIMDLARNASENDLVICLISGGASALLTDFPEGATLADWQLCNDLLIKSGADIAEINSVRKHLSKIKGGQLAEMIHPAPVVSLILSDVIGDPLDVIASGPTCADESTFQDAWNVLEKYNLTASMPKSIVAHIRKGVDGIIPETPKKNHPVFKNTRNFIIGNNGRALQAAASKAQELGLSAHVITDSLSGNYTDVAAFIVEKTEAYQLKNPAEKICLLFGGEPTVVVSRDGKGGRNQHLALYLAQQIDEKPGITILCAGTDGTDGNTDEAGAVVDWKTCHGADVKGIDAHTFLDAFDSYHFFEQAGGHIHTGATFTNVMDIVVVLIYFNRSYVEKLKSLRELKL